MTIHQGECFCALAKYNNFTRAAESMYLSQPAFSRVIAALEAELGVPLFVRDKADPRLTAAGEKMAPYFAHILEDYCSVVNISKLSFNDNETVDGTIVIGVFRFGMLNFLPYMTAEYKETHPRIRFDLSEHTGVSIFPALKNGDVDITHTNYIPAAFSKYMDRLELARHSFKALLPRSHPLAERKEISLAELSGERFVSVDRQQFPLINSRMIGVCANAGFSPNIVREFDTYTNIFDFIAEGKAVSLMAIPAPQHPGLVAVPVPELEPDPTFLVWAKNNTRPEFQEFLSFVKQKLRSQGLPDQHKM